MKDDDPSYSKDQQVDTISVDFIAILTKLVEDNDNLQKRVDDLEKSNLAKRVDTLEKSLKKLRTTQDENESLRKSMTTLISILQDPEVQKKITEPRKECHKSINHPHSQFTASDTRSENRRSESNFASDYRNGDGASYHESGSSKRFKFNEGRSTYERQTKGSSQRISTEEKRYPGMKYSKDTQRSSERSNFNSRTSPIENTERSYHEPHSSRNNSRRSNTEDRSSAGSIQRNYENKGGFYTNARVDHDETSIVHESKYSVENYGSSERRNSSHRLSHNENIERSSHERHSRNHSQCDTTEEKGHLGPRPKNYESKDGIPVDPRLNNKENTERSSHECHSKNKSQKSRMDKKKHPSPNQKSYESSLPVEPRLLHNETAKVNGPKYSEENHRKAEQSSSNQQSFIQNEILKISQPSSTVSLWKSTGEIDLKKVHSTPLKFITTLPNFLNYKLVSPLPSTPDQLKEKFKEHDNVKVSPMSSLTNEGPGSNEEKDGSRLKESKVEIKIEPRKEDCVEIQTVVKTDDAEHGVFKRKRRSCPRPNV